MARPTTRAEPDALSPQELYQLQEQLYLEVYAGQRSFTTSNLAEAMELSPCRILAGIREIAAVNPRVRDVGVDEWTIATTE